jgi:hypothetical protein
MPIYATFFPPRVAPQVLRHHDVQLGVTLMIWANNIGSGERVLPNQTALSISIAAGGSTMVHSTRPRLPSYFRFRQA